MLTYKKYIKSDDSDWVVFLHGLGGNSSIWYKQVDAYRPHFNLLFIDLFGHGDTQDRLDRYSFERIGAEILTVMDENGIDAAHLVGISLGSIIADAVGHLAPERVKSIVLGGAVLGFDIRARFLLFTGRFLKLMVPYMWMYRLFAFIMMPRKNHSRSRSVFIREARKLGGREFRKWFRLMDTLVGFYDRFKTASNDIPKLYLSGAEDHLFLPFVIRNYLRERLSAIHVIDKCGHVCNIERADEFNRVSLFYLMSYPDVPALKNVPAEATARRIPLDHPAIQKQLPMV